MSHYRRDKILALLRSDKAIASIGEHRRDGELSVDAVVWGGLPRWLSGKESTAEGCTQLSDFTFTFHFNSLEKEMATHSSVLAWRIPGTGEPGGLPSMGSHRVGHD